MCLASYTKLDAQLKLAICFVYWEPNALKETEWNYILLYKLKWTVVVVGWLVSGVSADLAFRYKGTLQPCWMLNGSYNYIIRREG